MAKRMNNQEVDNIENDLLFVNAQLGNIGKKICDVEGGALAWNEVNDAIRHIGDAIRECWKMRPED